MTLASRIGVMNYGEIIQVGTPTDIYEFPNCRFVADFIGSVNMFKGRIVEEDADFVRIDSEELGGRFYVDHGVAAAPNAEVWVAVRPEKVLLGRAAPADSQNCAAGEVINIAYMGNLSVYQLKLDSGRLLKVTQPNLSRHTEDPIDWGDRVYASWQPDSNVVLTT